MSADLIVKELDTKGMDEAIRRAGPEGMLLMDALGGNFVAHVQLLFDTGPDGLTYGNHVASQPGHPPNVDTSAYTNSLRWERAGNFVREIYGLIYGLYLEDSSELDRPHLNPAMEATADELPEVAPQYIKLGGS
jgi:hypothetical protein